MFEDNIAGLGGGGLDIGFYEIIYNNNDNIDNSVTM